MIVLSVIIILLLTDCGSNYSNENATIDSEGNQVNEQFSTSIDESEVIGYEGEWYRTNVASYQWARIKISNWKEGESFDVTILANYADYGGSVEGTATFIEKDTAVLYDENLENFLQNYEGDHGIYFQFIENSIIVTHDSYVCLWFGGGGIATAEGTYIQGEPEYTNCADVSEIFTENELEIIQGLLGNRYEELFENMIELGEITEYKINNGRLWKVYKQPYTSEWCNILIYEDGSIYVEGYSGSGGIIEFYTNSEDTEMPDIDLLEK
jgi:hypothetical protein